MWSNKPKNKYKRATIIKISDLVKSHCNISTVAFSNKYRVSNYLMLIALIQLYLVITNDFKFIFINELNFVVGLPLDMSAYRLVNFAHFYDEKGLLVIGGVNGVFMFQFDY